MTRRSGTAFSGEVPALLGGVRVDRAVALLTGCSRSEAARLVAEGGVRLDGSVLSSRAAPLRPGARLEIDGLLGAPDLPVPDPAVRFEVVHEDDALVVVDKPPGLVVHPGAGHDEGTLVHGLLARYPDLAALGGLSGPERPGIVQRLDRGTSGLLVVARTPEAYRSLVGQLSARRARRGYLALVHGSVEAERGTVDAPIGRSARSPTQMTVKAGGKTARTMYRVLRRLGEPLPSSLLAVELATGRTHQIRVHLAAIGHPVVGDDAYAPAKTPRPDTLAPGRLFLHAGRLGLEHPSGGEWVEWESPLPADLAEVVQEGDAGSLS